MDDTKIKNVNKGKKKASGGLWRRIRRQRRTEDPENIGMTENTFLTGMNFHRMADVLAYKQSTQKRFWISKKKNISRSLTKFLSFLLGSIYEVNF